MSYLTIAVHRIEVIGRIWEPCGTCALSYNLTLHDVENIKTMGGGQLTRHGCQRWLDRNAGDFQFIEDFFVDIEDFVSPWANEKSESVFNECMYPEA